MKKLILSLLLILSARASANALASIYNGDQFNLNGRMLVQDADHPSDFYVLPQTYHVKDENVYDLKTGELIFKPGVKNVIRSQDGVKYSVYTIRLELDVPGQVEMLMARNQLQRVAGSQARIKGLAPVCGVSLGLPLSEPLNGKSGASPDAIFAKYSLKSTEAGKCDSILATTDFEMEVWAPLSQEPAIAEQITSNVGLVLPPLELVLPYKYKDSVVVKVDAKKTYEQLKAGAGLEGSFKFVSAKIAGNMTKVFETLRVMGGIHMDCQNPDRSVCDKFLDQAKEILTNILVRYTSVPNAKPDGTPLVMGDKEGSTPKMVRVEMAIDQQTAESQDYFQVDFSNVGYSSIRTQAQLDISNVSPDQLDPQVRQLLQGGRP